MKLKIWLTRNKFVTVYGKVDSIRELQRVLVMMGKLDFAVDVKIKGKIPK